jgi:hypothetical protein
LFIIIVNFFFVFVLRSWTPFRNRTGVVEGVLLRRQGMLGARTAGTSSSSGGPLPPTCTPPPLILPFVEHDDDDEEEDGGFAVVIALPLPLRVVNVVVNVVVVDVDDGDKEGGEPQGTVNVWSSGDEGRTRSNPYHMASFVVGRERLGMV